MATFGVCEISAGSKSDCCVSETQKKTFLGMEIPIFKLPPPLFPKDRVKMRTLILLG